MLFDEECKRQEHFNVLLDMFRGILVKVFFIEAFGNPGRIEAEIDADVSVLFVNGIVEVGTEAENTDSARQRLPKRIEPSESLL